MFDSNLVQNVFFYQTGGIKLSQASNIIGGAGWKSTALSLDEHVVAVTTDSSTQVEHFFCMEPWKP
jgi:hypothetical protein